MAAVKASILEAARLGIVAFDCLHDEELVLIPYALFFAGDNPMQAEECSHAGLTANHFCHTCHVGGSKKFKASDQGFQTLFETPEEMAQHSKTLWDKSVLSGATKKVEDHQQDTGVWDTLASPYINAITKKGVEL
ncbi:hypothetical protein FRB93_011349 [Tulasnella sp. JGI-2019a]|nr:hypothetical protein FRB93_011349 [Tulasnella sp. JGI-2019a]